MISDEEINKEVKNALGSRESRDNEDINGVLNSIIDLCGRNAVSNAVINDYNLKRKHLKFENHVLKTIWQNLKDKWDDMKKKWDDMKDKLKDLIDRLKDIKELVKKLFKTINTVLDSLKKAFHQLEAVKEFKDLVNLTISWIADYSL
jgi:predicted RNase H-like nuclease (RuvC/YqgF family)